MISIRASLTVVLLASTSFAADKPAEDRKGLDFFESKIRPVLVRHLSLIHISEPTRPY